MRRYQCHKIVEAAEIVSIDSDGSIGVRVKDGTTEYHRAPAGFFARGQASIGDYLVRYAPDGYLSWSPKKQFEDGYSLIEA